MPYVIKSTGEKEEFNIEKLERSVKRAGIPKNLQQEVINHVKSKLYEHIPTSEIYHHIIEFLGKSSHPHARTKYSLKRAIMDFGPTGYPFEDFISEILKTEGYATTVRNILAGNCITHEIDVIAQKDSQRIMIEAKFHNTPGIKTNVHVALYTKARFDDIKTKNNLDQAWIITNTAITKDAINYSNCNNVKVISWNYPEDGSLADLIDKSGLSPITVLSELSQNQKQKLLEEDHVLCKTLYEKPELLDTLGLSAEQKKIILAEIKYACSL